MVGRDAGTDCACARERTVSSGLVVHVVDDDADIRKALAILLSAAGHAVRVYHSASAFLDVLPTAEDGCVLTDLRMPGRDDGLELQCRLAGLKPGLPVILMTGHADVSSAVRAMKAGAVDFVEKPFDEEVLLAAIRSALTRSAKKKEGDGRVSAVRNRMASLSVREDSVLQALLAGKPNKAIAVDLGISVRTVEAYRANVMTKMRADSLPDLVRMVLLARAAD